MLAVPKPPMHRRRRQQRSSLGGDCRDEARHGAMTGIQGLNKESRSLYKVFLNAILRLPTASLSLMLVGDPVAP